MKLIFDYYSSMNENSIHYSQQVLLKCFIASTTESTRCDKKKRGRELTASTIRRKKKLISQHENEMSNNGIERNNSEQEEETDWMYAQGK